MPGKEKDAHRSYHCAFSRSRDAMGCNVWQGSILVIKINQKWRIHVTSHSEPRFPHLLQGKGGPHDLDSSFPGRHHTGNEHLTTLQGTWLGSPLTDENSKAQHPDEASR